jgi:hypothetical protein
VRPDAEPLDGPNPRPKMKADSYAPEVREVLWDVDDVRDAHGAL